MTTTIQTTNLIGTGVQFTFAATGDSFTIVQGVTVGSTTAIAISFGGFSNLLLDIGGTLVSTSVSTFGSNNSINISAAGRYICVQANSGNSAILLNGGGSRLDNAGDITSERAIGVLSVGGNDVVNSGRIVAASGVFLGLSGVPGDTLLNTGEITANRFDDAGRDARFNNGVFAEGANTRIINLAGGVITAAGTEGAGVRLGAAANGSSISNDGVITATTWFGVDFSALGVTEFGRLVNTGIIRGVQGAFNGNDTADVVVNRGTMIGQILLGVGDDLYDGRGGRTAGEVQGGDGADTIDLRGAGIVNGDITGGIGADTIRGSDWDELLSGDADSDLLRGNGGDDTLLGDLGADQMFGGAGNDQLFGGAEIDALFGGEGDDVLDGADAATTAYGGGGDDYLIVNAGVTGRFFDGRGGAGDDTIDGGGGADRVFGGAGDDSVRTLVGNDTVDGGDGADRLTLSDGADFGSGGQGDDTLSGGNGADRLFGNAGNDAISGGNDADVLNGGFGDDNISGDNGADVIGGAVGNDTINGGLLRDVLAGGAGADVFVFTSRTHTGLTTTTADLISDMRAGTDMIDLSAIDARANVAGNQAFRFVGTASLAGASGRLRYDAGTGLVQGDVTGDGVADFAIFIQNRALLTVLDFVL